MRQFVFRFAMVLGIVMIMPSGCTHSDREEAAASSRPTSVPSIRSNGAPLKNELAIAAYSFQWSETNNSDFISYTITNPEGMKEVRQWMDKRIEALQKSAEIGPKLSIRPCNFLWKKDVGGHETEIILLQQYPSKLGVPKTEQGELLTNISDDDIQTLRKIFITQGIKSEPKRFL